MDHKNHFINQTVRSTTSIKNQITIQVLQNKYLYLLSHDYPKYYLMETSLYKQFLSIKKHNSHIRTINYFITTMIKIIIVKIIIIRIVFIVTIMRRILITIIIRLIIILMTVIISIILIVMIRTTQLIIIIMIIGITKDKQKAKRKHHLVQSKIGKYFAQFDRQTLS